MSLTWLLGIYPYLIRGYLSSIFYNIFADKGVNVILDFNGWFIAEINKYNSLIDCVNDLYLK